MGATEGCLATYVADARRYDELLDEKGTVRQHWRPLIDRVAAGDGTGAGRRGLELTRRLIIENGVTYNVYADPQGADRPWGLDPLPLVLTAEEWSEIEAGVAQRAQVLDALLGDPTLFTRRDEVETAWTIVNDIMTGWARMQASPLPTYEAGSWGPTESDAFLSMEGRTWRQP